VLASPLTLVDDRRHAVEGALQRARVALGARLDRAADEVRHLCTQVRALSPAATLDRGYAVVQRPDGAVVRDPDEVRTGDRLRVRVAGGELTAEALPG
jgi:exodeoxyribonuclease VII large subunit